MPPTDVLASRDCPLLPGTDLQCPYAEPGHECDIVANHPSSFGVSKIVFRGLTGHRAALELMADLGVDESDVVTVIWRDTSSTYEVDATRAVHALDPDGRVMPRVLGVFTIHRDDEAVRDDYMAILHNLQSLPLQLQRPWSIQLYSDVIETEFSASASPKTLTVMYQEYGGETLASILEQIADAGYSRALQGTVEFQRDIAHGYLQLVANRDQILRPNGIAHMDIHHENIVVRVPGCQMRLIDLGFAQNSPQDIVSSGLRRHDPIEYTMRKAAGDALEAARNRKQFAKLLQVAGEDADDYQYGTDPAFPLITPGDAKSIARQCLFLLQGTGVTWEQLYAFVWSKAVQAHGRTLVPLEEFQQGVYGADVDCRMLWDDFGIAWAGLVAYNTLQRTMVEMEPEMEALREQLQAKILGRFAGFEVGGRVDAAAPGSRPVAQLYKVVSFRDCLAAPCDYRDSREVYNVVTSRDCPLLPNDDLQCPYAPRGTMCDVRANHEAFAGASKVVFRGLTGGNDFIRKLLQTGCDPERVVTAIWQTGRSDNSAEEEIAVVEKIATADPQGKVFPRYWGHFIAPGNLQSVRSDYVEIMNRLRKQGQDTRPEKQRYLRMLHRQFTRGDHVNKKLILMYQDYGGPSLFKYVTKKLPTVPGDQLPTVQLALSRGILDLVLWREGTLCRAGIAHMDLHTNNIVLDEYAHFRMIDFGFHESSPASLMNGALQFHGPIEYAMLNAVVKVLQLIADRDTATLLRQAVLELDGAHWIVVGPQSVGSLVWNSATPAVLNSDWQVLERMYRDVLVGTGVSLQEMYRFVWASWQQVLVAGTGPDVDLAQFQRLVYGDGLRGMPRDAYSVKTQACLLWDDAEIAQAGIWTCNQLEKAAERRLGPAGVANEVFMARQDLQQVLLRRFATTDWAARASSASALWASRRPATSGGHAPSNPPALSSGYAAAKTWVLSAGPPGKTPPPQAAAALLGNGPRAGRASAPGTTPPVAPAPSHRPGIRQLAGRVSVPGTTPPVAAAPLQRPGIRQWAGRVLTWLQPRRLNKRRRSPGEF